jgi:hypothetical protein
MTFSNFYLIVLNQKRYCTVNYYGIFVTIRRIIKRECTVNSYDIFVTIRQIVKTSWFYNVILVRRQCLYWDGRPRTTCVGGVSAVY